MMLECGKAGWLTDLATGCPSVNAYSLHLFVLDVLERFVHTSVFGCDALYVRHCIDQRVRAALRHHLSAHVCEQQCSEIITAALQGVGGVP